MVYLSFWQYAAAVQTYPTLLVRGRAGRAPDRAALDAVVGTSGREYLSTWRALDERRDTALLNERLLAVVAVVFGGLGLWLAAIGLYGLLNLLVTERRQEFGLRLALGATGSRICAMVLGRAASIVCLGLTAGIGGAMLLTRVLSVVLGRPMPLPAPAIALAAALLGAAGMLAAAGPVRRASPVNPLEQIRAQ